MIQLRRAEPALVYGRYELLDAENPDVYTYTRSLDGKTFLVALSFSTKGGRTIIPDGFEAGAIQINNLEKSPVQGGDIVLEPYQAVVLELQKQ
jgi:oligo-1,6-glucosidase